MADSRPIKRARQACEPCRRKKNRCPGERPSCSYCQRLNVPCTYSNTVEPSSTSDESGSAIQSRLYSLEEKMEHLIDSLGNRAGNLDQCTPEPRSFSVSGHSRHRSERTGPNSPTSLQIGSIYLSYCEGQPLCLFSPSTFLDTLELRAPELVSCIWAMSLRFVQPRPDLESADIAKMITQNVKFARRTVMQRIADGTVELSTLQSLCLLSSLDFAEGKSENAAVHTTLLCTLSSGIDLQPETIDSVAAEERLRCLWSIKILFNYHALDSTIARVSDDRYDIKPLMSLDRRHLANMRGSHAKVFRIIASMARLGEVWRSAQCYTVGMAEPETTPWSPNSEHSKITSELMDFESQTPSSHRLHVSGFGDKTLDDLHEHRDFWTPWLRLQFCYHTIPCLLNHPFLIAIRLRHYRHAMPHSFLQSSFDQICLHGNWILYFVQILDRKQFEISDPILAYCVIVIATIHLQHSFVEETGLRTRAQAGFLACQNFIEKLSQRWPYVQNMATRLKKLKHSIREPRQRVPDGSTPPRLTRSLDAILLREILCYKTAGTGLSDTSTLFGSSLVRRPIDAPTANSTRSGSPDYQLVGSAGLLGHRTVLPGAVTYPPDHTRSSPYTVADISSRGHLTDNASPAPRNQSSGVPSNDLLLQPEDYNMAMSSWWDIEQTMHQNLLFDAVNMYPQALEPTE
ncbi:hypothetical protein K461DRAFT_68801 [Myriangium duriaei CBS 260.36]|uniref:Zn(2)-C6 fungal-type domain-containing protein n=1 Tax=Myriangium duriaei CBS 260.36 TaxID=1168546 RepID=A0A9P4MHQ0_9PEZI|nr:hypothetical protein K461DRAFT_68801 [Myriangium duriaei CBS 260.36]